MSTDQGSDEYNRKNDVRLLTCDTPGAAGEIVKGLNTLIEECGLTPWYEARGGKVHLTRAAKGVRARIVHGVYFHTKPNSRTPDPAGLIKIMERVKTIVASQKDRG